MKFFTAILGITALTIAVVAEYFSIFGILKSFDVTVAIMAGVLGLGKLVTTSYLYRFWNKIGKLRYYYLAGVIILMLFTSSGIVGYLTASYQEDSMKLEQMNTKIELFQEEYDLLKEDKTTMLTEKQRIQKNMDEELAGLTMEFKSRYYDSKVRGKVVERYQPLISLKDSTISVMNFRMLDVQSKISEAKLGLLDIGKEIGPIMYIAKMFDTNIDEVVKWFIWLIIFVFDPLAIALVIAYNRSLDEDRRNAGARAKPKKVPEKLIDKEEKPSVVSKEPDIIPENPSVSQEVKEMVDVEVEAIKEAVDKKDKNIYGEKEEEKMELSDEDSVKDNDAESTQEEILDNLDEKTKRLIAQKKNRSNLL